MPSFGSICGLKCSMNFVVRSTKLFCEAHFRRVSLAMSSNTKQGTKGGDTPHETDFEKQSCECAMRSRNTAHTQNETETEILREQQANAIRNILASVQHPKEEDWPNDTSLFESHCHLQLEPLYSNANEAIALAQQLGVKYFAVCGTEPGSDWQKVLSLAEAHPGIVIPSFGLHPWWIKHYYPSCSADNSLEEEQKATHHDHSVWLPQLETLLQTHPSAGVGEAGMDRGITKEVPYALQEIVLLEHIRLAGCYNRTLTLHCVGCWDRLFALLSKQYKEHKEQHKVGKMKACKDTKDTTCDETPAHTNTSTSISTSSSNTSGVHFPASIVLHSCQSKPTLRTTTKHLLLCLYGWPQ